MKPCILLFLVMFSAHIARAQQTVMEPTEVTLEDLLNTPVTDSSCHDYCLLGVCVWLRCSLFECSIETSVKVGHNNPDLVVSVYDIPGNNPFQEAEEIYGELEENMANTMVGFFHVVEAGPGHRVEGGSPYADQSLRYSEATAVGHPMSSFSEYASNSGYFCPSEATSMMPYFSSGFDALAWRLGLAEMLYLPYFLPGVRVIGEGGVAQQWGPVFPRTGFYLQKDYAKGAAVVAQRVGNIVTQTGQPHVYQALNGNGYNRTWLPGELRENDPDTGVWQMVAPLQDEQCYAFGENDVFTQEWSARRTSEDNRYVFNLWRPYDCCEAQGSYLFSIDIPPVCIP